MCSLSMCVCVCARTHTHMRVREEGALMIFRLTIVFHPVAESTVNTPALGIRVWVPAHVPLSGGERECASFIRFSKGP